MWRFIVWYQRWRDIISPDFPSYPCPYGLSTPAPSHLPGEHTSLATFTCPWLIITTYIHSLPYTPGWREAIEIMYFAQEYMYKQGDPARTRPFDQGITA